MASSDVAGATAQNTDEFVKFHMDLSPMCIAVSTSGLIATSLSALQASQWFGRVSVHHASGDLIANTDTEDSATCVTWLRDDYLAVSMDNGDVAVYHLAPNSAKHGPSHKLVLSCSLQGHDDIVASVQSRAAAGSAAPGQEADLTLATGSRDGSVKVWDANKPAAAQGRFLGHYGPVNAVAWQPSTPGSNLLASAGDDGRVLLWDLRSQAGPAAVAPIRLTSDAAGNGSVVSERGSLRPSTGHGDVALTSLAWITPTQLAAGAADGSVMLLDARNINAVVTRVLSGVHKGGVHALLAGGLTADATDAGVTFFSGGDDGCVQRLEVGEDVSKGDTWPAPVQVAKYSEYVRALAPLPGSDNTVLVGSWDGKLRKLASA